MNVNEQTVIYEQPLNELMRVCLRFEHLFEQLDNCLWAHDVDQHIRTVVKLLIDILNLLDRPDLKSKLSKEFNRHIENFSRLKASPDISQEALGDTLKRLQHLQNNYLGTQGKIAQSLRTNEFLSSIRQCLMSAGGDSSMDAPAYYYWLNQPEAICQNDIRQWLNYFSDMRAAVALLLEIVRHSAESKSMIAEKGFYHQPLDPAMPCQLIRVELQKGIQLYPEISAGRHRLSIRFIVPEFETRSRQTSDDVTFDLTCCVV